MKRILFSIAFVTSLASNVNAQLSVYSDGKVGVATASTSTPESALSVCGSKTGYDLAVMGRQRGIYGESNGQYLNWSYGVYGIVRDYSTHFQCAVSGNASITNPVESYRTFGVMGIAGNATSGWNYGVFGRVEGVNNGAGVYGTSVKSDGGTAVDGRYAGYFNGNTKVKGNLTVTGSINGVILSQASTASSSVAAMSNYAGNAPVLDKLASLSATCYYMDSPMAKAKSIEAEADTAATSVAACEIEELAVERPHYGIDVNELKETFPELVYEQEDGTVGINYMEMIPILIQAINNLRTEVKILKAGNSGTYSGQSVENTTISVSADGRVIGTKRMTTNR